MLSELKFYKDYFDIPFQDITDVKITKLKQEIKNDIVYKFIAFDDNEELNYKRLEGLLNEENWFSHYIYLNDPSEFEIKYSIKKVANKVNRSKDNIRSTVETFKEIYDVCSFSYCNNGNMWDNYSNCGNGVCLIFKVTNYDVFFPVDYIEKWKIDYNKIIINALNKNEGNQRPYKMEPLAVLPYVTKNPQNGHFSSEDEKEIRILHPSFEDGTVNQGRVYPNVKSKIGYKGCNVPYDFYGLKLHKIEIGQNCRSDIRTKIQKIIKS